MRNNHFKNSLLVLSSMLVMTIQMNSCIPSLGSKGQPYSLSKKQAKKLNTYICDYVPASEYVEIDGKKLKLPIREAYAEKMYNTDIVQVVVHYKNRKFNRFFKDHTGEVFINFGYSNPRQTCTIWYSTEGDISALPDSINNRIIEHFEIKTDSGTFVRRDTLQTFWLVKKPQ